MAWPESPGQEAATSSTTVSESVRLVGAQKAEGGNCGGVSWPRQAWIHHPPSPCSPQEPAGRSGESWQVPHMDRAAWRHQQSGVLRGDEKDSHAPSCPTPGPQWETTGVSRTGWGWCGGKERGSTSSSLPVGRNSRSDLMSHSSSANGHRCRRGRVWACVVPHPSR